MTWIAIRMLTGDPAKFFGLVFGVAFSTLLIAQQLTIFVNLLERGSAQVHNVPSADVWVMDPSGRTAEVTVPLPSTDLYRVRGVTGVSWAVPLIIANAVVRTAEGKIEGVSVIGVDNETLIGLPRVMLSGARGDLTQPDSIFIDGVGARKLFPDTPDFIGTRFELNDQRAIVRGTVDANPSFTSGVLLYTRYANALNYVPGSRNRMNFVLVRAADGVDPKALATRITRDTGLKARTRDEFARDGVDFIIETTGIPINFGITVALGFIVGVAIVGLTFSLFIRDNIKQFGALKAIGVTNAKLRGMVAAQAGMVGFIGYGIGVVLAATFIFVGSANADEFKGFYSPWQIPTATAVVVMIMILLTGFISLRAVIKTDPAEVFR